MGFFSSSSKKEEPEDEGVFGGKEKVERKELERAFRKGPAKFPGSSKIFPKAERDKVFEELFPQKSFLSKKDVRETIKEVEREDRKMARYIRHVTGME